MAEPVTHPLGLEEIPKGAWPALWALVLGFFMILVDSTIVSVGTPAIMTAFHASITDVLWVTSAYLLGYAVPLLITGRLGDRYGPKRLYMSGLVVFTLASLACGITGTLGLTIGWLVAARVVQGMGASMMSPQTMSVITRTFPASRRGAAMAMWGSTAGVANLVGPIAGGLLIDSLGWEWIFFINIPVGIVAIILAARLVPKLETHVHSFDWLGVVLSAVGTFAAVFALQEGETYHWGTIWGPISVPALLATGLVVLGAFIWWQSKNRREPLVPLTLFRDRNFSVSNVAITMVGFAITAMMFPFFLYAQVVRGLNPMHAALLLVPQAVMSIIAAPISGKLVDRLHPRLVAGVGLTLQAASVFLLSRLMAPGSATWKILLVSGLLGVAGAFVWGPVSTAANRNLPREMAGAGAGVYNTTRQMGAVVGSAAIAALMSARISAHLPGVTTAQMGRGASGTLPAAVLQPLASALSESMLLPCAALLIALVAAMFYENLRHLMAAKTR